MACSKYELGYESNRFEIVVSQRFHCPICLLVLKDPVMCKNEHYYCSSCIEKHLENSAFCPTCLEYLSVDTLKEASRIVKNYLSELNIRCDFYPRGCPEMVQLGDLKRHVRSCGFLPVQCSNDGCNILVNARDKLHHEAEVCDFRKLKCHDCGQLKNEVQEMKKMVARQDRMRNEMKEMIEKEMTGMKNEIEGMKDEMKEIKNEVKNVGEGLKGMIVQVRLDEMRKRISDEVKEVVKNEAKGMKVEIRNEIKEMKKEMKEEMKEMKEGVKEIVMNAVQDVVTGIKSLKVEMGNSNQSSQATCSSDERENILVGGGYHKAVRNATTECFNWADQTWSLLNSAVLEGRSNSCSFLYRGQMIVAGGRGNRDNKTNTLKCLDVSDPAATWKDFAVNLPVKCENHKVVNHNDLLFMSGGWVQLTDGGLSTRSNVVYEVQLIPPYSSKILTRLPQPRSHHGMEMFDQKLFIFGGYDNRKTTTSVIQYDLVKDECKEMPPLPYAVQMMATVLWRNNVLLIGGWDEHYRALNKVVMYDVITGRSHSLPCMKKKRYGCTAVLTGNVVVVMGGQNEKGEALKSVESFDLELQVWRDLPDMIEPRGFATAVIKPNH